MDLSRKKKIDIQGHKQLTVFYQTIFDLMRSQLKNHFCNEFYMELLPLVKFDIL